MKRIIESNEEHVLHSFVVMAGSKGKEAFRRPLRQLKLRQEEEQLC